MSPVYNSPMLFPRKFNTFGCILQLFRCIENCNFFYYIKFIQEVDYAQRQVASFASLAARFGVDAIFDRIERLSIQEIQLTADGCDVELKMKNKPAFVFDAYILLAFRLKLAYLKFFANPPAT